MIHEVAGDILHTKATAIAHGIAPNDHFDKGLALALREKWPMMFKDYRHYANQVHPRPGEIWEWGGFGTRIFNLITQDGSFDQGAKPGRASLENVNHALKRLRHEIDKQQIKTLALPRLATGVGGLSWDAVHPIINKHLADFPGHIYLYSTFKPKTPAVEPGV